MGCHCHSFILVDNNDDNNHNNNNNNMVKKIVNLVGGALMCATLAANAQEEQPGPFSQGVSLITAVVQQTIPILLPIAEALAPAAEDTDEAIYMMMPGLGRKLLQRMEMPMPPVPPPREEMMMADKEEMPMPPVQPPKEEMMMADKKEEMSMPPVPPPKEEMMMADKKEEMPMPPVA